MFGHDFATMIIFFISDHWILKNKIKILMMIDCVNRADE